LAASLDGGCVANFLALVADFGGLMVMTLIGDLVVEFDYCRTKNYIKSISYRPILKILLCLDVS
jgi:hypothetical protein